MIEIGRYRVYFTRYPWIQTHAPTKVKRFLFMSICIEARPTDVDKEQQFLPGTPMEHEGRLYRYCRAKSNLREDSKVVEHNLGERGKR